MSKHAKPTLVRFYRDGEDVQFALVKDWETVGSWAFFSLPATSSVGQSLMTAGLCKLRVVVMESEEVEWRIQSVERSRLFPQAPYDVKCRSLVARLRDSEPTDERIIKHFEVEQ